MTWPEVKEAYDLRIAKLVPASHREAVLGFSALEEHLKKEFPEVIDNPFLLVANRSITSAILYSRFYRSNYAYNAADRIRKMLKKQPNAGQMREDITADDSDFGKPEIIFCAARWLKNEGWENVKPTYQALGSIDLTAEKNGRRFIAGGVSSIYKSTDWDDKLHTGKGSPKQRLGAALLALMEELNKDKKILAAILVADNADTRQIVMQYAKHIKKTGIKIYWVKSASQVTEQ